ncbi:MAG: hypothetical protein ABRQ39_16405 [Candidatus Eremiobacterota bacterium]
MVIDVKVDRLEEMLIKTQEEVQKTNLIVQGMALSINKLGNEMFDFKKKTELSFDRMNKKWEDVIKKLGTLVEDMVIPNIEFIAEKYFMLKNVRIYTRTKIYNPVNDAEQREFDVIAVYSDRIILVEAKSNPRPDEARDFIDLIKSKEFFKYFPEYTGRELIPVFASFHIPGNVLKQLTKHKIFAMGIKEDTMDILNLELLKL